MSRKFGGLKLSVEDDSAELDQSFKISNQGTFIAGNFKINKDGMKGGSLAAAAAVAHAKSLAPSSALSAASSSSSSSLSSSGLVGASPIKPGGASSKAAAQAFGPDELVILRQLGRGASGIVYLALHLPTLTLVAQKTLNVFQQDVRHQVQRRARI
jgi:hypothetical protein